MLDLRYHLVSLTAVFLALTIGIVIGSSLGSSEQQKAVVQRLEQKFQRVMDYDRRIQTEDSALRHRLSAREQAERQLLPNLIQDRLSGVRLAVVVCGDGFGSDAMASLQQSLTLAAAEVTSTTRLPGGLGPIPAALRPALREAEAATPEDEERAAARAVVRAILGGDADGKLTELARATGVTIEGSCKSAVPCLLVISAALPSAPGEAVPPSGEADRLAGIALTATQELSVRALAAGTEEAGGRAFLRAAADRHVTTIDNVDTAAGQIALVLALSGARGSFSGKPDGTTPAP